MTTTSEEVTQKVLIVDDEEDIRRALSKILEKEHLEVLTAANGMEGVRIAKEKEPDLIFMDIKMPVMSGLDALAEIRKFDQETPVVVLTAYLEGDYVSRAITLGAYQYLVKPSKPTEIVALVRQALRARRRRPKAVPVTVFADMIGKSSQMQEIFDLIRRISHSDVTVLIQGESGTGKELVARAIHDYSLRKGEAYVTVDCGTLPDTLMESEIFGYEPGAFTDARKSKPGKFELANGGTLFLDEIGNLSPSAQAKLLRALEEKKITRLGGKQTKEVDVRIIAATNMNLEAESRTASFREDLYYRLNVFRIPLPPLRDRPEDIQALAEHFVDRFAKQQKRQPPQIGGDILDLLVRAPWRGNVRELRNLMERATLLADETITLDHLPRDFRDKMVTAGLMAAPAGSAAPAAASSGPVSGGVRVSVEKEMPLAEAKRLAVEGVERWYIEQALVKTGWNKSEAAKLLDLNYKTLREKIKEYGLERKK